MTSMSQVGIDPETGEFDADIVEAGASQSTQELVKTIESLIQDIGKDYDEGALINEVIETAVEEYVLKEDDVDHQIQTLKSKGEIYEPRKDGYLRLTKNQAWVGI